MSSKPKGKVALEVVTLTPDGAVRREDVPMVAGAVGAFEGDRNSSYRLSSLTAVTKRNIGTLAGLKPELHGIEIDGQLAGDGGVLRFRTAPDQWCREIVEQDPELKAMEQLLDELLEAKRDPRKRAALERFLSSK